MKYLKKYEQNANKKYWLLPTDDRLEKSLDEINCNDKQKFMVHVYNSELKRYVFVSHNNTDDFWGWQRYNQDDDKLYNDYYESEGYEFMGTINIIGDDPKVEKNANKFNI